MAVSRLVGPTTFRRSLSARSLLLLWRSIAGERRKLSHKKAQKGARRMGKLIVACTVLLLSVVLALGQDCTELKTRRDGAETKLNDWPALARYREDNKKVTTPARNEQRVVFMGDSITDSWDNPTNGGFFPGKPYVNRGISGQTTPQMLIRFRRDVIELKPKVVVILAGTNDLAGNTGPTTLDAIQDNLTSMAELAAAHGIRVVFASLLPVSDYEMRDGKPIIQTTRRPPAQINALNSWMKDYA